MKKPKSVDMITTVDFGIFGGKIMFSCGYSFKQLIKELKKQECYDWAKGLKKKKDEDGVAGHAFVRNVKRKGSKTTHYYLCLPKSWTWTDDEYVTLAHEALHLCQYKLSEILNRDVETEAEAYTHTHIMKQILSRLKGETKP